jgi:DNA topoisomerase-2
MPPKKNKQDLGKQYQKKDLHQHIFDTPDTYVGGCDTIEEPIPVFESPTHIGTQSLEYIPALYNIFNEIVVNARDQSVRLQGLSGSETPVSAIKVDINVETGLVTVWNDGSGIDVVHHPSETTAKGKPLYIPEMIFGHLLTSTNYDKDEQKVVGGKNGYGAKLTNIFSTFFKIETVDHVRQKKFVQEYSDNMKTIGTPKVTKYTLKPYTKISWIADFARFGIAGYTDAMVKLMERRTYDIAGITDKKVQVHLNGTKVAVKDFEGYATMYLAPETPLLCINLGLQWSLGVSLSTDKFEQVSFVNGIMTSKGGKHVDFLTKQLTTMLQVQIKKRSKKDVNETYIKNYLKIFINCMVVNPSFDSQTKERLITPPSKFGSKPEIPDKFVKQLLDKTDLMERVLSFTEFKLTKETKKTDGQKRSRLRDIPKLDDANHAGTAKSESCTLILTEGDSAKTMAVSGLSVVGRDAYGVFPLRGKVLNVKEATSTQIMNNAEITYLKKILGLETGKHYTNTKSLRYGKVMIMTDQDHDGSHIKGLVMNVFHTLWPSLLELNYLTSMITPIVKVSQGKETKAFYTMTEYDAWTSDTPDSSKWKVKYYKGLGTSTANEAREYFGNLKMNNYLFTTDTNTSMNLAFSKSEADQRKTWLYGYDVKVILDHTTTEVPIEEFIHKELIHFSNSDTFRSIGSLYDGLKPSQRKILYACLKRNLYSEIKVAQLSGYVSETSAYHHGEASLQSTIVGMAQTFVGSNNLNLLQPNGQFGTRIMGGHDSASARYIHTELHPIVPYLFRKEDNPVLEYNEDDGQRVEPTYYVPIVPLVLVNGMNGIGTGFSTSIPKYAIHDVVENLKRRLNHQEYDAIHPSYRGFQGTLVQLDTHAYLSKGVYRILNPHTIEITELPLGKWTDDYKKFLDTLLAEDPREKKKKEGTKPKAKPFIVDYINHSSDTTVHFTITVPNGFIEARQWSEDTHIDGIEAFFKLTTSKGLSLKNIHLYNEKQQICKYHDIHAIMDAFYEERHALYVKRKAYQLGEYEVLLAILGAKIRFIREVMEETILIYRQKKDVIIQSLVQGNYPKVKDKHLHAEGSYEYLLKMSILSFTEEDIAKLEAQHDTANQAYLRLQGLTIEDIWTQELDEFVSHLE